VAEAETLVASVSPKRKPRRFTPKLVPEATVEVVILAALKLPALLAVVRTLEELTLPMKAPVKFTPKLVPLATVEVVRFAML